MHQQHTEYYPSQVTLCPLQQQPEMYYGQKMATRYLYFWSYSVLSIASNLVSHAKTTSHALLVENDSSVPLLSVVLFLDLNNFLVSDSQSTKLQQKNHRIVYYPSQVTLFPSQKQRAMHYGQRMTPQYLYFWLYRFQNLITFTPVIHSQQNCTRRIIIRCTIHHK